ncbi:uncharacterized protein V1516DRAFT_670529 [Lipomyces oligophaga]|uniref:uncharacterized protein n=1 Tax=Lipomyces oligophaga TaxID=45792 RepID=UPI0034CFEF38
MSAGLLPSILELSCPNLNLEADSCPSLSIYEIPNIPISNPDLFLKIFFRLFPPATADSVPCLPLPELSLARSSFAGEFDTQIHEPLPLAAFNECISLPVPGPDLPVLPDISRDGKNNITRITDNNSPEPVLEELNALASALQLSDPYAHSDDSVLINCRPSSFRPTSITRKNNKIQFRDVNFGSSFSSTPQLLQPPATDFDPERSALVLIEDPVLSSTTLIAPSKWIKDHPLSFYWSPQLSFSPSTRPGLSGGSSDTTSSSSNSSFSLNTTPSNKPITPSFSVTGTNRKVHDRIHFPTLKSKSQPTTSGSLHSPQSPLSPHSQVPDSSRTRFTSESYSPTSPKFNSKSHLSSSASDPYYVLTNSGLRLVDPSPPSDSNLSTELYADPGGNKKPRPFSILKKKYRSKLFN